MEKVRNQWGARGWPSGLQGPRLPRVEQRIQMAAPLSLPDVARTFDRDLEERGVDLHLDLDRIEDPGLIAAVNALYPEEVPLNKAPSIFDAA